MMKIEELTAVDEAEYCVLKKLCGDDSRHGFGGLPFALVQGGFFIAQFGYSFAEYLNLFLSENREDCQDFMNTTQEPKSILESQRYIWTTSKVSVKKLSDGVQCISIHGNGRTRKYRGRDSEENIERAAADRGGSVKGIVLKVIAKELILGIITYLVH